MEESDLLQLRECRAGVNRALAEMLSVARKKIAQMNDAFEKKPPPLEPRPVGEHVSKVDVAMGSKQNTAARDSTEAITRYTPLQRMFRFFGWRE